MLLVKVVPFVLKEKILTINSNVRRVKGRIEYFQEEPKAHQFQLWQLSSS
jgi:hypothetical protein